MLHASARFFLLQRFYNVTAESAAQAVGGFKVFACVSHQLTIGGVVNAFNTDNLVAQLRIVRVNVFDQAELGTCRANDQDFLCAAQGDYNFVVEVLVFRGSAHTHDAAFVVQMLMWVGRANDGGFDIVRADMHDMCFGVINPYNGVIVGHDFPLLGV
jgi:hypothetical protein